MFKASSAAAARIHPKSDSHLGGGATASTRKGGSKKKKSPSPWVPSILLTFPLRYVTLHVLPPPSSIEKTQQHHKTAIIVVAPLSSLSHGQRPNNLFRWREKLGGSRQKTCCHVIRSDCSCASLSYSLSNHIERISSTTAAVSDSFSLTREREREREKEPRTRGLSCSGQWNIAVHLVACKDAWRRSAKGPFR